MSGLQIVLPPKIYADTMHLIEIARIRQGCSLLSEQRQAAYRLIDECITQRHFGLVFNDFATIEWVEGKATRESARQIAEVIDSARLQYHFAGDSEIFTWEILKECQRIQPEISVPVFQMLPPRERGQTIPYFTGIINNVVPGYVDEECVPEALKSRKEPYPTSLPVHSARYYVEHAFDFKHRRQDMCQERIAGFEAVLATAMELHKQGHKITKADKIAWMKGFLKIDLILGTLNPNLDVAATLGAVDFARCPAVNLWRRAFEKRILARQPVKPNDVDDWMFLPLVPYVDLMLTERNLRGYIAQADPGLASRVTHDPTKAADILRKWVGPAKDHD